MPRSHPPRRADGGYLPLQPADSDDDFISEEVTYRFLLGAEAESASCWWTRARRLGQVLYRSLRPRRRYKNAHLSCTRIATSLALLTAIAIVLLVTASIIEGIVLPSYASPPLHYHEVRYRATASSVTGRGNPHNEKIYIASNIIDEKLVRGHWGAALLNLIDLLGPDNVFVSIYENDSGAAVAASIQELERMLPCRCSHSIYCIPWLTAAGNSSIVSGAHVSLDTLPSIVLPSGEVRVKRLTYLTEVRNRLLRPLDDPSTDTNGDNVTFTSIRYDKILFLNDVYFDPVDALQLLFSTNLDLVTSRTNYRAACAADFVRGAMFYDTFVVRDLEGYGMGLMFFPWFTGKGQAESRSDVLAEKDAVRVRSCWGGMAAFDASPFLRSDVRTGAAVANRTAVTPRGQKSALSPPLRFRHQTETYWEASECCLIHADLATWADMSTNDIFLNPYVRVAYSATTWKWLSFFQRYERGFRMLQTLISIVGYPEYNPRRLEREGQVSRQWRWDFDRDEYNGERMRSTKPGEIVGPGAVDGQWKYTEEHATPGGFCGQRRLFVMVRNISAANRGATGRNWEKGPFP